MQKLDVDGRVKGKVKTSLASPPEPRRKQNKRIKTRLLAYIRIIIIISFTYFNAVKFPCCLTASPGISAMAP